MSANVVATSGLSHGAQALAVAQKVCAFVQESGFSPEDAATLEGLYLAMQMLGGPKQAAYVLRYCSFSRD